jgi:hypothetical protein
MPDKKPWWEQEPGETLPDYIKRIGETVAKSRKENDLKALNTAKYLATIPNRAERDINKIGSSLKSEADKLSIKLGNKNFSGSSGGGGGGATKRIPTPAKPGKRPPTGYKPPMKTGGKTGAPTKTIQKPTATRGNVRKIR